MLWATAKRVLVLGELCIGGEGCPACNFTPQCVEGGRSTCRSACPRMPECPVQSISVSWKGETFPDNNSPQSCCVYPSCVPFLTLKDFELTLKKQHSKCLPATLSSGSACALLGALHLPFIGALKDSKVLGERREPGTPCLAAVFGKGKKRSHFIFVLMESVTGSFMSLLSKDLLFSRSHLKTYAVFSWPLSLSSLDKRKAAGMWILFQESRVQSLLKSLWVLPLVWGLGLSLKMQRLASNHSAAPNGIQGSQGWSVW